MNPIPEGLLAALADRYRLERELGAGGMATVYLAEDLKHHRQVAIKVLRPDLAASLDPINGGLVGAQVEALLRWGNRAGARRALLAHRERLQRELGMEPDPHLTQLEARIVRGH